MAKELATTGAHPCHEMLDEEGQAGLLRGTGLDFRPNGRDLRVGGNSTDEAKMQKL